VKTVIQCDFDGTITEEDQSFLLLDAFASGNWRQLLTEYRQGKITVGYFNTRAFAMVKEDKQTLVSFVKQTAKIRPGFHELLAYCRREGVRLAIVSNGLDFYINTILTDIGVDNTEVFAAQAQFAPRGIEVKYIGPDGAHLDSDFKEAYVKLFLTKGYRVVYVGNGLSDISAAKYAHWIFARSELLTLCQQTKLNCTPFVDLNDVVTGLKLLENENPGAGGADHLQL
jgi:2-hydroxy-3-keto-5-methylthiopentenyl-1-phosphate phosphatase